MVSVKLTPYELMLASSVGCMRHIAAVKAGRADRHGAAIGGWQLHIEGALGELAAAKACGMYWSGSINTFSGADLERNVQIRTRSSHSYELIVRDSDKDSDVFVLVTGVAPDYVVRGWVLGSDARRDEWRQEHGGREPAFFVPHAALRPLAELGVAGRKVAA